MSYVWTCKGCLIRARYDPDTVSESCIARFGKKTCHFCGHIQDQSWFKHVSDPEVINKLEALHVLHVIRKQLRQVSSEHYIKPPLVEDVEQHPSVGEFIDDFLKTK